MSALSKRADIGSLRDGGDEARRKAEAERLEADKKRLQETKERLLRERAARERKEQEVKRPRSHLDGLLASGDLTRIMTRQERRQLWRLESDIERVGKRLVALCPDAPEFLKEHMSALARMVTATRLQLMHSPPKALKND